MTYKKHYYENNKTGINYNKLENKIYKYLDIEPRTIIILDKENSLVISKDEDNKSDYQARIITHYRLVNDYLFEVKSWKSSLNNKNNKDKFDTFIKINDSLIYHKLQQSIYNYRTGEFIVEPFIYNDFFFGKRNWCETIDKCEALFGIINIKKDEDEIERFLSVINLDGTIRNNLIYKINKMNEIEYLIDLQGYGSIKNFIKAKTDGEINQRTRIKNIKRK